MNARELQQAVIDDLNNFFFSLLFPVQKKNSAQARAN